MKNYCLSKRYQNSTTLVCQGQEKLIYVIIYIWWLNLRDTLCTQKVMLLHGYTWWGKVKSKFTNEWYSNYKKIIMTRLYKSYLKIPALGGRIRYIMNKLKLNNSWFIPLLKVKFSGWKIVFSGKVKHTKLQLLFIHQTISQSSYTKSTEILSSIHLRLHRYGQIY